MTGPSAGRAGARPVPVTPGVLHPTRALGGRNHVFHICRNQGSREAGTPALGHTAGRYTQLLHRESVLGRHFLPIKWRPVAGGTQRSHPLGCPLSPREMPGVWQKKGGFRPDDVIPLFTADPFDLVVGFKALKEP